MKKIILIVEDKTEEIEKAKGVISKMEEFRVMVASNLEGFERLFNSLKSNLFGVVTDLHFPVSEGMKDRTENNPNGLSVIALCVQNGVRVAVCSDINHHFCQYVDEPVKVLSTHQNYPFKEIPLNKDNKSWLEAINDLINL